MAAEERWKAHPGTGLYVSDLGRVAPAGTFLPPPRLLVLREVGGHRVLSCRPPQGELRGRKAPSKTLMVARLVLETWVGPPPEPGMVARTRDGNPANCTLKNLVWGPRTGGPRPRPVDEDGPRRPGAPRILARVQERQLCRELADGVPVETLARRYGVSASTVRRYKRAGRSR